MAKQEMQCIRPTGEIDENRSSCVVSTPTCPILKQLGRESKFCPPVENYDDFLEVISNGRRAIVGQSALFCSLLLFFVASFNNKTYG